MIAYDKTLLDNTYLDEEANRLKQSGFISVEQFKSFKDQAPCLKSQKNIFLRIVFFILGCLLYSSICGLVSLMGIGAIANHFFILVYIFALIGFGVKEFLSTNMNYFGYGLDDAFILGGILALSFATGMTFELNYSPNYLLIIIVMAIASSMAYLRYLNLPLALLACIGITGSISYIIFSYLTIGKSILPFVLLLFAAGAYFIVTKKLGNLNSPYYYKGLQLAKGYCLVLFYLSGNYYVVREANAYLSGEYYLNSASSEIPFALIFWTFTFIIPVVYFVFALKNKDRMLLWIGFVTLCFSIFTIRMYHHVLPPEAALTFGGLLLFGFTYFSIKKLKHKENGITFKADRFTDPNAFANLQVLVSTSQFGLKPEVKAPESPMEFGGGGFSGGGSGGSY